MTADDRTVHASKGSREVVRYNRAGKWYVEMGGLLRYAVKLEEAVDTATDFGWTVHYGRPGGSTFDRRCRAVVAGLAAAR